MPADDPSPSTLRRLRALLWEHGVPPEEARELFRDAVQEVSWRRDDTVALRDARTVRAVERRARAWRAAAERRRPDGDGPDGTGPRGPADGEDPKEESP